MIFTNPIVPSLVPVHLANKSLNASSHDMLAFSFIVFAGGTDAARMARTAEPNTAYPSLSVFSIGYELSTDFVEAFALYMDLEAPYGFMAHTSA